MKTSKSLVIVFAAMFAIAFSFSSCKKDNSGSTDVSLATADASQAIDAESQDAIADKAETDVDNDAETVQSNDFNYSDNSSLKFAIASYTKTVTINHSKDTTIWPKVITIVYDWKDTVNTEVSTKTGTVIITLDTIAGAHKKGWRLYVKRKIEFQNLTITTQDLATNDISSVTINGIRSVVPGIPSLKWLPNTNEIVIKTTESVTTPDSMRFTLKFDTITKTISRFVNRTRSAVLYYKTATIQNKIYIARHEYFKDTLTIDGTVTGINAAGKVYTRDITTPLVMVFAKVWPFNPIIISGELDQTIGDKLATFSYHAVGNKTMVTIEKNGKSKTITRTIGRKINKWW